MYYVIYKNEDDDAYIVEAFKCKEDLEAELNKRDCKFKTSEYEDEEIDFVNATDAGSYTINYSADLLVIKGECVVPTTKKVSKTVKVDEFRLP